MGIDCKTRFNLYPPVTMLYQEYDDRQNDMVNAFNNGEMNLLDMQSKLADLNGEYESNHLTSTSDNWVERAEEATQKMKERIHEIRTKWAHAYIDGGKVKIKKGPSVLPLTEMSVLEARLLANEILSITNKQRRK